MFRQNVYKSNSYLFGCFSVLCFLIVFMTFSLSASFRCIIVSLSSTDSRYFKSLLESLDKMGFYNPNMVRIPLETFTYTNQSEVIKVGHSLLSAGHTECPKIHRKSVLHLFKYKFAVYLTRCSTDMR